MPFTDDQALDLYIQAVHFEAKASACSAQLPQMAVPLRDAYAAWQAANSAALQQGETVASLRGMRGPQPPSIIHMAHMQAQLLNTLPLDDLQRRCNEVLVGVRLPK